MLFLIPEGMKPVFHMKDVKMPLDIAFLDENGVILDIKEANLSDKKTFFSPPEGTLYTIEVRQGWFEKQGIKRGDIVSPGFSLLSLKETTL